MKTHVATVSVCTVLVVAAFAASCADVEPLVLVPDGTEEEAWQKWGDPGDRFISFAASDDVAADGKHSLCVELSMTPEEQSGPGCHRCR